MYFKERFQHAIAFENVGMEGFTPLIVNVSRRKNTVTEFWSNDRIGSRGEKEQQVKRVESRKREQPSDATLLPSIIFTLGITSTYNRHPIKSMSASQNDLKHSRFLPTVTSISVLDWEHQCISKISVLTYFPLSPSRMKKVSHRYLSLKQRNTCVLVWMRIST